MKIIILIVLVIFGLTAVACTGEVPSPADTQTASLPTPDVPATVEAGIRGTREAETAIDATVEAKVAATLTTSAPSPTPMLTATPGQQTPRGPPRLQGRRTRHGLQLPRIPLQYPNLHPRLHLRPQPHLHPRLHLRPAGPTIIPLGLAPPVPGFMRRWNLRYPRAGHQLVGREPISLVEVRLRPKSPTCRTSGCRL